MNQRLLSLFLASFLVFAVRARAESPRDELLRLVPDNVGFCLLVEDLRGHSVQLRDSPFFQQFEKSPVAGLLKNDADWRNFIAGREKLEALLGTDVQKLRDDILGDAVVFAVRPAAEDKPNDDRALVLLRAREAQELAKVITRLNDLQKVGGEFTAIEPREHKGQRYFERV